MSTALITREWTDLDRQAEREAGSIRDIKGWTKKIPNEHLIEVSGISGRYGRVYMPRPVKKEGFLGQSTCARFFP